MTCGCFCGKVWQAGIQKYYEGGQETRNIESGTNYQQRAVEAVFWEVSEPALADSLSKGAGSSTM